MVGLPEQPARRRYRVLAPALSKVMRLRSAAVIALCMICAACGSSSSHARRTAQAPGGSSAPRGSGASSGSGATGATPANPTLGATGVTLASGPHPLLGIGDNNIYLFADPRFRSLGITQVRDDIPWNILANGGYPRRRLAAWLGDAHTEHLSVLISFDRSRQYKLPSVAAYSAAFLEFRRLYPWVTQFVTWDEANFFGEPTAAHVLRAVRYYQALRRDCPSCTILAPDLLDLPRYAVPPVRYAREFIRDLGSQPPIWALNDYVGANRMSTASTRQLLAAVTGKIWIVEVAGIISNGTHAVVASAQRIAHAADVDRFIVDDLGGLSPRIEHIYLYEWRAGTGRNLWDSALISADGQPRPGYDVLADTLAAWGIKPNCAISTAPPACAASSRR